MNDDDASAGRLIVLCGLPGSGKSTLARRLVTELGAVRLCSDDWMAALSIDLYDEAGRARVEALQEDLAIEMAAAGLVVVYESGGWTRAERDVLRVRVRATGAAIELRLLDLPLDELAVRLSKRNAETSGSTAFVSHENLVAWAAAIEKPRPDELSLYDEP